MNFEGVTWSGPQVEENELLESLPPELAELLRQINGFILRGGALHVRGAVTSPMWHSLGRYWTGEQSLASLYSALSVHDVPFGQDCVGDQLFLRDKEVWRLSAEDGVVENRGLELFDFLLAASNDPVGFLNAHPLIEFMKNGASLQPGQLLHAYPPFCTREARGGVSLKAVPADEAISSHGDFARQIRDVPDGQPIRVVISDEAV